MQAGPAPRRAPRVVLLAAVAACAACGLVYELCLLTLGASLTGGGVVQTSLVVAGYVAALGVGALLAKPLLPHAAVSFVAVEIVLGLAGGLSAAALYVTFSFHGGSTGVLVAATAVLGALVGAEVPLLLTLLQRWVDASDPPSSGRLLADLNAADYAGALVGGLAWPFLLLPLAGNVRGAAVTGLVNLTAALVVLRLVRPQLGRTARRAAPPALLAGAAVLGLLLLASADLEVSARQRLYADPVVAAVRSPYQEIVLTRRDGDLRLFLDGDLQFSSRDEHRYTEALVHPVLARGPRRVLVLGGGDGLAAREVLRSPSVQELVQVELDPAVLELAGGRLAELNRRALQDPRVRVVVGDAFTWLREHSGAPFDAVVVDLPDPDTLALGRLYSVEFYGLATRVLAPRGLLGVQAGSPYATPAAYWRTVSTLQAAGLHTSPYHVDVPSFGDWGFVLADRHQVPELRVDPAVQPALQFLDPEVLAAAAVFARDRAPRRLAPTTLDRPRVVTDLRRGWARD
ncbi:MAG: polyamine aminopropyltransferase [Actinomycetota bacterium]|nr:polyamine aminopropyltransferase [Actinomycetota bacterium]